MRSVASRPATPVSKEMRHASFHHRVRGSRAVARRRRLASSTAVQATIPPTEAPRGDPIVGAWLLTVDEFPDDPPQLVAFHADGTYHEVHCRRNHWHRFVGGNRTELVQPDVHRFRADDEGSVGMQTFRAAGEVSEDGQSFTAEFTIEFTGEGAPAGEYGPGHVTATRINVEPMGTPAGSLEDLFAQLTRAPRQRAPHRWGPRRRHRTAGTSRQAPNRRGPNRQAPNQQAPNRRGPRRPILRWQPRRASRRASLRRHPSRPVMNEAGAAVPRRVRGRRDGPAPARGRGCQRGRARGGVASGDASAVRRQPLLLIGACEPWPSTQALA